MQFLLLSKEEEEEMVEDNNEEEEEDAKDKDVVWCISAWATEVRKGQIQGYPKGKRPVRRATN